MKWRLFALAATLLCCQFPLAGQAQQPAGAPGVAAAAQPHPPPRARTPPRREPPGGAPPAEPHPAPSAAPAGPTVYNVEVIVFRANSTLGTPEDWNSEAARAPAVPVAAD